MDLDEFARVATAGLGRAILHLQTHDSSPYRTAVLEACLHDTRYDSQSEESREQYLFELINLTGEPGFYRDHLLRAFRRVWHESDYDQIVSIIGLFAREGDKEARQLLYDAYTASAPWDASRLPDVIVELDGTAGLLFVAERLPTETYDGDLIIHPPSYLVHLASEKDDPKSVQRALAKAAPTSPRLAAFRAAARPPSARRRAASDRVARLLQQPPDYKYVRRRLAAGAHDAGTLLSLWGRHATESEIERAAADLLRESDPRRVRAYLRLFHHRRFPLDPAPLLDLAESAPERGIAHAALFALKMVADPRVRARALDLLSWGDGRGARLLTANYEDGDYARIEQALLTWRDRDGLEDLGWGLQDVVEAHPIAEAAPALLALYERGPCSQCRRSAVDRLRQIAELPAWLGAECRYDASPAIRAMIDEPAGPGER